MKGLLVDTSFLIRLLKVDESLNKNANDYYRYCLEHQIPIFCSTIAIAEYCVKGSLNELPLKDVRILAFNISHAERAGEIMRIALDKRPKPSVSYSRVSVTNDSKMLAQADVETTIDSFITSDAEATKLFKSIKEETNLKFDMLDLNIPRHEIFGELDL